MLLRQLPPSARRGGQRWSTESELIAAIVDHLAMLTYVTLKANGAKSAKKPKPVPRPPDGPVFVSARAPASAARGARHAPGAPGDAPVRASSWMDAAAQLSLVPGVKVKVGDG